MKKAILLFAVFSTLLFTSCSGDDGGNDGNNNPGDPESESVVKFKIGGQQRTFTFVTVSDTGENEFWINSTTGQGGLEILTFSALKGESGNDSAFDFMYSNVSGNMHTSDGVAVTVSENTDTVIKGTFSGPFVNFDGETVNITDGTFEVYY